MKSLTLRFPQSGYKSILLSYPTMILLAVLEFIVYYIYLKGPNYWIDSMSYMESSVTIMGGELDIYRTPVYPFLIGVFQKIFGNRWDVVFVCFQFLITLISAVYFYKIAERIVRKPRYVFWSTAFFLLYPGFFVYNLYIMTETISIAGMVFLAYCLLRFVKEQKMISWALWANFWLLFLIYLRPIFICLIPILLGIFIWKAFTGNRTSSMTGIAGCVVIIASVILYQRAITQRYQIHSISCVTIINNYATLRYDGIIDPTLTDNPRLQELLIETLPDKYNHEDELLWTEFMKIQKEVGYPAIEQYEKAVIKKYPYDVIKGISLRWEYEVTRYKILPFVRADWKYRPIEWLQPNLGLYALGMILYCIFLLIQWKRKRRVPQYQIILLVICAVLFVVTALGAQSDYTRLNLPAIPLALILFANLCTSVRFKPIE